MSGDKVAVEMANNGQSLANNGKQWQTMANNGKQWQSIPMINNENN